MTIDEAYRKWLLPTPTGDLAEIDLEWEAFRAGAEWFCERVENWILSGRRAPLNVDCLAELTRECGINQ